MSHNLYLYYIVCLSSQPFNEQLCHPLLFSYLFKEWNVCQLVTFISLPRFMAGLQLFWACIFDLHLQIIQTP